MEKLEEAKNLLRQNVPTLSYMSYGSTEENQSPSKYASLSDSDTLPSYSEKNPKASLLDIALQQRLSFIHKVYSILTIQTLLTATFCILIKRLTILSFFVKINFILFITIAFIPLVITCLFMCIPSLSKKTPYNHILLITFTICLSYVIGYICAITSPVLVSMVMFMTFVELLTLTIYSFYSTEDLSLKKGGVYIAIAGFVLMGVYWLLLRHPIIRTSISLGCVIVFAFYVIYDTQLIIENKKEMIENDEYILGSFRFYVDFLNVIFDLIKKIINKISGKKNN